MCWECVITTLPWPLTPVSYIHLMHLMHRSSWMVQSVPANVDEEVTDHLFPTKWVVTLCLSLYTSYHGSLSIHVCMYMEKHWKNVCAKTFYDPLLAGSFTLFKEAWLVRLEVCSLMYVSALNSDILSLGWGHHFRHYLSSSWLCMYSHGSYKDW